MQKLSSAIPCIELVHIWSNKTSKLMNNIITQVIGCIQVDQRPK